MSVRIRRCLAASLALVMPTAVNAHPIHTTYAVVARSGTTATLQLRAFADDFSAAVARFNQRAVPADSSAPSADTYRYLAAKLSLTGASGGTIAATPCGVRRAAQLTYVCLQLPVVAGGVRIANRVLTELHGDQVNIVQVTGGGTLLFTRTSGAQALTY